MLVEIEKSGTVRVLRMNHPPENRYNRPFLDALNQAFDELEADASARAVVITSRLEKFFGNGLDLQWLISQPREIWAPFLIGFDQLLLRTLLFPKPLVSAINGHAFAGGLFFAFATDWRVMREDKGWCCIPEIDLGIDLPPGNAALIAHVLGTRATDRLALSGQKLGPAEALAAGMIDETAPAGELMDRALDKARELGKKIPHQFARHKATLRREPARILREEDPTFITEMLRARAEGKTAER